MLNLKNLYNLTQLLWGVKAREISERNTRQKLIIIDNAWSKKFIQFNTITMRCKSKRNKMKEIQGKNE